MQESSNIFDAARLLNQFPTDEREKLVAAVEKADPALELEQFATDVAEVTQIDQEKVRTVIFGIAAILPIDPDVSETITGILTDALQSEDETVQPDLPTCLQRLFASERTLGITSKAHDVMWGTGHVYLGARTISQIRPIFFNNLADEPPEYAAIVHELRVNYRTNDSTTDFVVAMDREQVQSLIQILQRALEKEEVVRTKGGYTFMQRGIE